MNVDTNVTDTHEKNQLDKQDNTKFENYLFLLIKPRILKIMRWCLLAKIIILISTYNGNGKCYSAKFFNYNRI